MFGGKAFRTDNQFPPMTTDSTANVPGDDHEHANHDLDATPVTDHVHDNSWSANLETPEHAEDRELLVEQALSAIDHTAAGHHVNLVTHGDQGHPREYLFDVLAERYEDEIEWSYVDRCGCGGHVLRVQVHR